jgi:hypothetical protein
MAGPVRRGPTILCRHTYKMYSRSEPRAVILSEAKDRFRAKAVELPWIESDPSAADRCAPASSG